MSGARVLVVEDDQAISYAVRLALEAEGHDVVVAPDLRSAFDAIDQRRFNIALLDVRMERVDDGFTVARRLRADRHDTSILFVTAADDLADRLDGFSAGGDDYLTKPFVMAELLARVRALLRRQGRAVGGAWAIADLVIDEDARCVRRGDADLDLTPTEFDLLVVLARHPGRVLSKDDLLRDVWTGAMFDENLVEVHVSALRRKLEAHGDRLVHTVRGGGYVFRGRASGNDDENQARNAASS